MTPATYPFGEPGDAASLFNTAMQHYVARRLPQAEQACRRVLELLPRRADALNLLGVLHAERNDLQAAIGYFREAIAADPNDISPGLSLAMALHKVGQLAEAEAVLRQITALHPEIADAHLRLGRVLMDQGRTTEAEGSFRLALVLNPNLIHPNSEFGAAVQSFGLYVSYRPDSDVAFNHHPEFKALLPAWIRGNEFNNSGDIARLLTLMLNVKQVIAEGVPGDMAEVGVFRGNSAAPLAHYARSSERKLFLFDTFEGFDRRDLKGVDRERLENFSETSLPMVQQLVGAENVSYIKGYFPQSIPSGFDSRSFAVVHLDCDLYEPMKAGLEFFYPRLSPGGLLLLHDYSSGYFPGAKQAVDEFVKTISENIVLQPDKSGTAVIRKCSVSS